jgi:hypothetical protein
LYCWWQAEKWKQNSSYYAVYLENLKILLEEIWNPLSKNIIIILFKSLMLENQGDQEERLDEKILMQ